MLKKFSYAAVLVFVFLATCAIGAEKAIVKTGTSSIEPMPSLVVFDGLEIVFGNKVIWSVVENRYSDKNGAEVFLVPMTIKNTKNESHGLNMFSYSRYGSKGTKLDRVGSFFNGEVEDAGKMRPGATQETFMAFLYDGDGDYFVEFESLRGAAAEVKLPIKKGR